MTVNGAVPVVLFGIAAKSIVWLALVTSKDRSTSGAARKLALPACEARTVTVPVPVKVTWLPDTVAGPLTTLKETGRPEEAVATSVSGSSSNVLLPMALKVMVWSLTLPAGATSKEAK